MNKNQKASILFLLLAKSFIAAGFAFKSYHVHSLTVGGIVGLLFIIFAINLL
ncbi:hypothetical protein KHA80_22645 [Anaerobacillus sp. HL2]|nr:hypothetical protein KHA80_22645 [Anaerobacillus sp. HL2]